MAIYFLISYNKTNNEMFIRTKKKITQTEKVLYIYINIFSSAVCLCIEQEPHDYQPIVSHTN